MDSRLRLKRFPTQAGLKPEPLEQQARAPGYSGTIRIDKVTKITVKT